MRLLVDENLSPTLVRSAAELGIYALSVPHAGLGGKPDHVVWHYAFENDFTVVTANVGDYLALLNIDLHPGLIVLRHGGLARIEQWKWLEPVLRFVLATADPHYMVNRVIEVWDIDDFMVRDMPSH